ncbi:hypothetical protein GCM10008915_48870 [Bifidobacterium pullorum subsp. gallinarum]
MYYEFAGSYFLKTDSSVVLLDKNNNKQYKVEGNDVIYFQKVLPLLIGSLSIQETANLSFVSLEKVELIIELLASLNLIKVREAYPTYFTFLSNSSSEEIYKVLSENQLLKNICTLIYNPNDIENNTEMIIALEHDQNQTFFIDVNKNALRTGIPWLKVSPYEPFIYFGPIFAPDGGPCYECFINRVSMNRDFKNPQILHSLGGMSYKNVFPTLERELIKIYKDGFPSKLFNYEFEFNTDKLTLNSTMVLKHPDCKMCETQGMVYI